jgi:hypothetical protein
MSSILTLFGISARVNPSVASIATAAGKASTLDDQIVALGQITPESCGMPLIRIGPDQDGGYLIPDDMVGIDACFSPGTNNYKEFEDHLAANYGIKSFMCDYSSDIENFRTPPIPGMQFFEKKWLDVEESDTALDINKWVRDNSGGDGDLLLQMDIEGAEYRNLLHAKPETLSRFRIIVLEVHSLHLLNSLEFLHGIFLPVFGKLSKQFICVHAHPNNCCGTTKLSDDLIVPNVLELTFLRRDRIRDGDVAIQLPHPLDVTNVINSPPMHIQGILRKNADQTLSDLNALKQTTAWMESLTLRLAQRLWNAEQALDVYAYLAQLGAASHNLARGKQATQSSMSIYSTSEGANGAVNGTKTGSFGFHTDTEENPWWCVDLQKMANLSAIVLYNRIDACSDRIRALLVSTSTDGESWQCIYQHGGKAAFGGARPLNGMPPLLINLTGLKARYVRLQCQERTALHLDEVEVYGAFEP